MKKYWIPLLALVVIAAGYTTAVYFGPGRDELFIADGGQVTVHSGGEIEIESGGVIDVESGASLKLAATAVTANATELNKLDNAALDIHFAGAAGGSNVHETTIRLLDALASTYVTEPHVLIIGLSDDSEGIGLTSTSASGTVQAKSGGSYSDIGTLTSKKALVVQTDTDGKYVLEITDDQSTGFYVFCSVPGTGAQAASSQIGSASYAGYGS